MSALPSLLQAVAPFLDKYGYLAVGLFCLLQRAGIPLMPAWTTLMAASVYAGAGRLNIFVLAIVATLADIIGSAVGFAVGRYGGEPLVLKYGKYISLTPKRLKTIHRFFNNRGGPVLIAAVLIGSVFRNFSSIVAGTAEMKWAKFITYSGIASILWASLWTTVGYEAGSHINQIYKVAIKFEIAFFSMVGSMILILFTRKVLNSQKSKK